MSRSDVERFEVALNTGDRDEALRIWPRVKARLRADGGESVPLSLLAHEERVDPRTLRRRIGTLPFVRHPSDRVWLVDRDAYRDWKAQQAAVNGGRRR